MSALSSQEDELLASQEELKRLLDVKANLICRGSVHHGFVYVEGCWTCSCWTLTASSNYTSNNPPCIKNQRLLV